MACIGVSTNPNTVAKLLQQPTTKIQYRPYAILFVGRLTITLETLNKIKQDYTPTITPHRFCQADVPTIITKHNKSAKCYLTLPIRPFRIWYSPVCEVTRQDVGLRHCCDLLA